MAIAANRPAPVHGLRVDYTSVLAAAAFVGRDRGIPQGVLVQEVADGSPAAKAGIKSDNIILTVNGQEVNSPKEFYDTAKQAAGPIEVDIQSSSEAPARKVKLP